MKLIAILCVYSSDVHAALLSSKVIVKSSLPLTAALQVATDKKLGKQLDRYDKFLNSVTVNLKVQHCSLHDTEHRGNEAHVAEITAHCKDQQVSTPPADSELAPPESDLSGLAVLSGHIRDISATAP